MEKESLQELFVEQLKDLYSAENQLVKALTKMAKAASNPLLKTAFETHLQETQVHVERLTTIFEGLEESPKGKTCQAMKGLVEEGKESMEEHDDPEVLDAALIADAQRVEHYEMAGYGTVVAYAKLLGEADAQKLLKQTLDEEGLTDKKLTQLADKVINLKANK